MVWKEMLDALSRRLTGRMMERSAGSNGDMCRRMRSSI